MSHVIEEVVEVGVRKIVRQGNDRAIIYIPKYLRRLFGRRAIVVLKVLREDKES